MRAMGRKRCAASAGVSDGLLTVGAAANDINMLATTHWTRALDEEVMFADDKRKRRRVQAADEQLLLADEYTCDTLTGVHDYNVRLQSAQLAREKKAKLNAARLVGDPLPGALELLSLIHI